MFARLLILTSLASSHPCTDDLYKDCAARARRGDCEGGGPSRDAHAESRHMLAECRESCRKRWSGQPVPWMIEKHGGLDDFVVDPFGFKYQLCGPDGGFTTAGRDSLLFQIALNHEQPEWVPALTKVGFEKIKIPTDLWRRLLKDYERVRPRMVRESCILSVINCQEIQEGREESHLNSVARTFMMELDDEMLESIKDEMLPLAEKWSGVKLSHTSTYGVRRYTNNSWLVAHLDRLGTHVVSAIMNFGQKVDRDWPLHIQDNQGNHHQVILAPGEMVWYESARLSHGRMEHFQGEYFDNLFLHYRPKGRWYTGQYQIGVRPWPGEPLTASEVKQGTVF